MEQVPVELYDEAAKVWDDHQEFNAIELGEIELARDEMRGIFTHLREWEVA